MTILAEIVKWSPSLPAWQQDAIRRLFAAGHLTADDSNDLYAILKAQHGIPDAKGRTAVPLNPDDIAVPQGSDSLVQIKAVKNLKFVNALAEGQRLSIAPAGLTVIYGDNGVGKSGYSRVLKKACRARDQREAIRGNARFPDDPSKVAAAVFEISIDGQESELQWVNGKPAPPALSAVAIFDAHCARAYIDNHGDFAFVPYGMDILKGLGEACDKLKEMLVSDSAKLNVKPDAFLPLSASTSDVGKMLSSLATAMPDQINKLASMSDAEVERHALLDKNLKEADPKSKANELRLRATRLIKLAERCSEKISTISEEASKKLREAIAESALARQAADLAAKAFMDTPGQLPGTGGEAWQLLLKAARNFTVESHPDKTYPHLGAEAACPLCQQPLGAAAQRLETFEAFVQQEAEKNARTLRDRAETIYKKFSALDISIAFTAEDKIELAALDQALADDCSAVQASLVSRHAAIKAACKPGADWSAVDPLPPDPRSRLTEIANNLNKEVETLEKSIDEAARAVLFTELKSLEDRRQLTLIRPMVLQAVENLQLQSKLKACEASVRTRPISEKSTDLSTNVVTKDLADALNAELKSLRVDDLKVSLKPVTVRAKTDYKLVLELPGAAPAKDILSEGEQRAIAIASFLAEVNKSGGRGGVVFDDPVSSLDHRRRGHVAERLIKEALKRQVIVFTHDLYFMCLLEKEAVTANATVQVMSLRRTAAGFGVTREGVPFDGAKVSDRVKMLRKEQESCATIHKAGDVDAAGDRVRTAYDTLRKTWERAVEEILLNGVVWRFDPGISTLALRDVTVDDADWATIYAAMSKCSTHAAHDGAAIAQVAAPHPDDLAKDIETLETWRKATVTRRETLRATRPK